MIDIVPPTLVTPAEKMAPYLVFQPDKHALWKTMMVGQADALAKQSAVQYVPDSDDWKDDLIERAVAWDGKVRDPRIEMFIKRHFWKRIQELTQCDLEDIFEIIDKQITKSQREKSFEVIEAGALDILNHLEDGNLGDALSKLRSLPEAADPSIVNKPIAPVVTLKWGLPMLRDQLRQTQGKTHTGFIQGVIPEWDEATFGFDGLNLITASSGGGKTMLTIQTVLEILERYPDTCCLFVSADMTADRVLLRMLTNRTRLPIRTVKTGSTSSGWSVEEQKKITEGFSTLEKLGNRLRVVDRFSMPNATRSQIQKEAVQLMDEAECDRCILVIDFLELLPIPDHIKNPDHWIIEEVRILADNGYTVFCICESGKSETNYQRGSAKNIKGDYRKVMRSDCVLTINQLTDDELLDLFDISSEGYVTRRVEKSPYDDEKKPMERLRRAMRIRKALQKRGEIPVMCKIDKGRDGAECTEFYAVNHFRRNYFSPMG